MNILVDQIRFSRELEISYDSDLLYMEPDKRKLYNQDGKIYIITPDETKDLFSDDFYDKYEINIDADKIENNLINITCSVIMKSDNSVQYSITTAVKVYNTQNITGDSGNIFSYYWGETE
jgi:hypothetical protein